MLDSMLMAEQRWMNSDTSCRSRFSIASERIWSGQGTFLRDAGRGLSVELETVELLEQVPGQLFAVDLELALFLARGGGVVLFAGLLVLLLDDFGELLEHARLLLKRGEEPAW